MTISASAVKELREKTNVGMMDCKKALEEAKGDMEQAIEILRKKGLSFAQKKASRSANDGILGHYYNEDGRIGLFVEINCETDFVVKTRDFQDFVSRVTDLVKTKGPDNLKDLLELKYDGGGSVQEILAGLVAKIGENIQIRRFVRWEKQSEAEKLGFYLHAGSKIGVLVSVADPENKLKPEVLKELAMHVAAMHPQYVRPGEVPSEILEKEKEILKAGVDSKKPPQIQEKIVEGKLKKFFSEVCFENQIFVKDPEGKRTVEQWLKGNSANARIEKFVRLQVGA